MPDIFMLPPLCSPHKGWSLVHPAALVLVYVLPVILCVYLGVCPACLQSASLVLLSGNFCYVVFSYMQLYPSLFALLVITFVVSLPGKFNINYMLINPFLIYSYRHLHWLHLSLSLPLLIGVSCLL